MKALFDEFPRREQIGQTDHSEIVHERRAQQRGGGAERGHARKHPDFHAVQRLHGFGQFPDQTGKGVDSRVAAADDCRTGTFAGPPDSGFGSLHLPHHAGGDDLLTLPKLFGDQIDIKVIADDDLGIAQSLFAFGSQQTGVTGTEADDVQPAEGRAGQNLGVRAAARVIPPPLVFSSSRLSVAASFRALASHTLGAPIF